MQYIEKKAVIDAIWQGCGACAEEVEQLPAVEIVRCKECKYWKPNWCVAPGYYRCIEWPSATREHDFCSRGERREHENT